MRFSHLKPLFATLLAMLFLAACSIPKLEARLEANPQCKDIINPKTGALMPCPETDKAFYRSVGLEPQKPAAKAIAAPVAAVAASPSTASIVTAPKNSSVTTECKPQLHKKTGVMMPCPAPD